MKKEPINPKLQCYPGCCENGCFKYENKKKLLAYAMNKSKQKNLSERTSSAKPHTN